MRYHRRYAGKRKRHRDLRVETISFGVLILFWCLVLIFICYKFHLYGTYAQAPMRVMQGQITACEQPEDDSFLYFETTAAPKSTFRITYTKGINLAELEALKASGEEIAFAVVEEDFLAYGQETDVDVVSFKSTSKVYWTLDKYIAANRKEELLAGIGCTIGIAVLIWAYFYIRKQILFQERLESSLFRNRLV